MPDTQDRRPAGGEAWARQLGAMTQHELQVERARLVSRRVDIREQLAELGGDPIREVADRPWLSVEEREAYFDWQDKVNWLWTVEAMVIRMQQRVKEELRGINEAAKFMAAHGKRIYEASPGVRASEEAEVPAGSGADVRAQGPVGLVPAHAGPLQRAGGGAGGAGGQAVVAA